MRKAGKCELGCHQVCVKVTRLRVDDVRWMGVADYLVVTRNTVREIWTEGSCSP